MPCDCRDCRAARRAADEPCPDCGCQECGCPRCENCGRAVSDTCPDCGYGTSCGCCDCASPEIPYRTSNYSFHGEPSALYPRYLGVEIECFLSDVKRRDYTRLADKWDAGITSDGSIRAEEGSREVEHVTSPARGDAFVAQIRETCALLSAQKAGVNRSTGLHVHVDARDFTTRDILAFARLYSRVEKTLYGMVSKARRTNDYSRPWGETLTNEHNTSEGPCSAMDDSEALTKREKALDIATYGSESHATNCKRHNSKDGSRYHGVNFNSLACHGTIEFRLHHGTTNTTKIEMWAAVCSALVEFAKKHTEDEIKHLRGTPAEILDKVVGDAQVLTWCRKRRAKFDTLDRQRRGLAPRARPVTPEPAPAPEVPDMPDESGEEATTPPRANRSYGPRG